MHKNKKNINFIYLFILLIFHIFKMVFVIDFDLKKKTEYKKKTYLLFMGWIGWKIYLLRLK